MPAQAPRRPRTSLRAHPTRLVTLRTGALATAAAASLLAVSSIVPAAAADGDVTVAATSPVVTVTDGATARVTVTLSVEGGGQTSRPVRVRWSTGKGTATPRDDYRARSGSVVFPVGSADGATATFDLATRRTRGGETAETVPITMTARSATVTATPLVVIDAHDLPYLDASRPVEERVSDLLSRMSLADKVGQMTQAERMNVDETPDQIADLRLGSLLSGGGSTPKENTPKAWADMVDGYQLWTRTTPLQVPLVYGIDSVHGNGNLYGSTIFPHNIGLGASRDPAIVEKASHVAASETRATGIPWTFAPCLCVARDTRWGRTYEAFGEDPSLVTAMETSIDGFQGNGTTDLSKRDRVLATAKHIGADGDTEYGSGTDPQANGGSFPIDQGITVTSRKDLERIDLAPYGPAVKTHHVGSVMPSYSSIDLTEDGVGNPLKAHASKELLTGYLKDTLGFDGFVISDYAAIRQISPVDDFPGQVAAWVNAGGDMAMEPSGFEEFATTLTALVGEGRVPMDRVDDAVSRILTKKFELGLFEKPFADRTDAPAIGSPAHRAVARTAASQSQVLLKNGGNALPLAKDADVYVAGDNADDLGNQIGGWNITWQGQTGTHTRGTTILSGMREVAPEARITYSADGSAPIDPAQVGVVVVGETPYSEGYGDVGGPQWAFDPADENTPREEKLMTLQPDDQELVDTVCSATATCVVLTVSGRPLVLSDQLPQIDALVASWLPGSEGAGVADTLFGDAPYSGQLPQSWPRTTEQGELNVGDADYSPLYPFGWGLTTGPLTTLAGGLLDRGPAVAPLRANEARRLTESLRSGGDASERLTGRLAPLADAQRLDARDPQTVALVNLLRQLVQQVVADPSTGVAPAPSDRIARADVALLEGDTAGATRLLLAALAG